MISYFCNTRDPHGVGVLRYIRHSSRIITIGYDTLIMRRSKSLSNREMWSAKILTRQLVDQGSVCEFSHQAAKEQSGLSFAKLKVRLKCYFPAGLRFLDLMTRLKMLNPGGLSFARIKDRHSAWKCSICCLVQKLFCIMIILLMRSRQSF